jgi:1-acyl-sn-glycerol-3-phosphate acyltransferase
LGFCKLALQTGCCLVPCYVFGANEMYTRLFGPDSLLAGISSRIQMSLVVWYGRWGIPFGVVPHQVKMVIVLGEPIEVTKVDEPTPEQVQELHAKYVAAICALFDRHKHRMGEEWVQRRGRRLYLEDEMYKDHLD